MDCLNNKQKSAVEYVLNGDNIFLTGSGGTGKSFTIKYIIDKLKEANKSYGLTATTGSAASLIGGQTINSYLGIGLGNEKVCNIVKTIVKNNKLYKKLSNLDVLIIDEISMMCDEMFEYICNTLSVIKSYNNKELLDVPFGGVQMIFVGDFCQLAPVKGSYCFLSPLWNKSNIKVVILEELIRQTDDLLFQKILNIVRKGRCTDNIIAVLEKLKNTEFAENIIPTKLYPINADVEKINLIEINKLKSEGYKTITYNAFCNPGNEKKASLFNVELTEKSQIMITRNIDIANGLINGTRGYIKKLFEDFVIIKDVNDNVHTIHYFKDIDINDKKSFISHIPIRTSYALSIHKSQGMTIDAVELDLGNNIFAYGQTYTTLSRAKNLNSIKIINIDKSSFNINPNVKKFYYSNS